MLWLLPWLLAHPTLAQEPIPSQNPHPNFFNRMDCFPTPPVTPKSAAGRPIYNRFSEFGSALTPRGDLRVLVIYAGFTNDNLPLNSDPDATNISNNNSDPDNSWPQELNGSAWGESLPRSAATKFYSSLGQFSTTATDKSLSNFYYQMSQFGTTPFQMMAVNFPVRVNVTATTAINQGGGWETYSTMVLDRIRTTPALQAYMTGINRSLIDARTNSPEYQHSNVGTTPDNKVDYTIIIWRFNGANPGAGGPQAVRTMGLDTAPYSNGAYAAVPAVTLIPASGSVPSLSTDVGFTQTLGGGGMDNHLFIHEFAHTLYWAPHVNTANGVLGSKFYATQGQGMVNGGINGWERWFLGWAPLQCNGQSGDLTDASALTNNGLYRLRDFITTGDVLRIRLPNTYNSTTGTYQYLWLENRQKRSVWDQSPWTTDGQTPSQPFATVPTGIEAYVEDMGQTKRTPVSGIQEFFQGRGANGLKYLSAIGNYDLRWDGSPPSTYNNHLWGNNIYNMTGWDDANPISGQHDYAGVRADRNGNGVIAYGGNANAAYGTDEGYYFVARDNAPTDGFIGLTSRFNARTRIGLDTNPALSTHPDYDAANQQLAPYELNGVSVELIDIRDPDGGIMVKVRFDDTDIQQDTRWTGNLRLWPGLNGAQALNILPGVTLRVDHGGTPNRTTPGPHGDFVNPTYLYISNEAEASVADGGRLQIGAHSTVFVAQDGRLLAESGARIDVEEGGLLSVYSDEEADALQTDGQLRLHPGGRLEIRESGVILSGRPTARVEVYPNPTNSQQLRFSLREPEAKTTAAYRYRLLTLQGLAVRQGHCAAAEGSTTLTGLPAGTYILELTGPRGQRLTRRVQVAP